ncbi:MAG: universal stress protein [Nitrospira sp.]|jgi:nucleotide-binding universal stress UspA family protein|nr:universal stress protein [Nitrospira sp.]MDH4244637.1 universal stress protein [Nitrospira sp.]MDH4355179.1 universal stress protein [Nitrospira sp.]MDH5317524.1 universal stress protein [Nitrospira sp.]
MRVVIGVDWSDQAFAAVTQTFHLYHPSDVTLVHGVDLGILQNPVVAQAGNVQGYEDFRHAMVDAGRKALDHAATMVPPEIKSIRKVNEVANPAQLILDSADNLSADLVVVGVRGRSRLSEMVLGSVSHRVLLHGSRPTLIVKGASRKVQRVLVAIEDRDDADRIAAWLTKHPFADPAELCVLHAVVPIGVDDPYDAMGTRTWWEGAERYAEELVKSTASKLMTPRYSVSTKVATGHAASVIEEEAKAVDLVVITSHGRKGISRFLLGSVSHAVVHHVSCPVLVLR